MFFITHYMEKADERGYAGYRVLPQFSVGTMNILPFNPSRPDDYTLSVAYTHEKMEECTEAMYAAARQDRFPGQHSTWSEL